MDSAINHGLSGLGFITGQVSDLDMPVYGPPVIRFDGGCGRIIDLSNTRRLRKAKFVPNPGPPSLTWLRPIPPGSPRQRQEFVIGEGRSADEITDLHLAMLEHSRCESCGARPETMHLRPDGTDMLHTQHDPSCPESIEQAGPQEVMQMVPNFETGAN